MKRIFLSIAIMAAAVSCTKEQISDCCFPVRAQADDFKCDGISTRTSITQDGSSAPSFAWKQGDVIGVIPMDGKTVQSNYEVSQIGADPKCAAFDGGVWSVKEGRSYAAYYPFNRVAADSGDKLVFSFLGQTQCMNNNLEHIGAYDYMYAPPVTASSGSTSFKFRHLISLIRLQVTVPQADAYTGVTLESSTDWFAEKAELTLSDGSMASTQSSRSCTIALNSISVSSGAVLTIWFAMLPTNALSGRTLTVKLNGLNTSRSIEISRPGTFEAGKAYTISCSAASEQSEMESVDLGLSVKWANVNLGAKAPEEDGDYYAWGELNPYYRADSQTGWEEGKTGGYVWGSYKWCEGSSNSMTKYCSDPSYGTQDARTVLLSEDDAAHSELGGKWRMPTGAEFQELIDKCSKEWTKMNGVNGIKFTGSTGNSIFLPTSGYRTGTGLYLKGLYGYYWSSSLTVSKPCNASCLYFSQYLTSANNGEINNRCYGQSIRPVSD